MGVTTIPTDVMKVGQIDTQPLLRAILGKHADTLRDCAGGCGVRLVSCKTWANQSAEDRKVLKELKVSRLSSERRCRKCAYAKRPGAPSLDEESAVKYGPKVTPELLKALPDIWSEIQMADGGLPQLAKRLGVSNARAGQLVQQHNLPRSQTRTVASEVFLEELEHLASFGLGVAEIAARLKVTPDALAKRVVRLHRDGKTRVNFEDYMTPNGTNQKEAA